MAPDVCRPFSAGRAGMVLGEGAAMFVLETEENAKKRGAQIYAEFAGFGMSSDAKDITTPDTVGASRAVINCLRDAGLEPDDIDYINAHGTGTRINDATETAALKLALGARAKKIALSSSKSLFGHALGARRSRAANYQLPGR
jgi:nodulation protein E